MPNLYMSMAVDGNDQVVRRPLPSDAIGAALRGAFCARRLPSDMARLIERLNQLS